MRPAFKAFTFRRGDTPGPLGVRLWGRNIRSQAIIDLPRATDVVSWTIGWRTGSVTKTTSTGGGLVLDRRTRFVLFPITREDIAAIPAGAPIPFSVRVTDGDGAVRTYLTGTIAVEGDGL